MPQLSAANWLFIGINLIGWSFSLGILVATVKFIRERLTDGDKRMDKHEEKIEAIDRRIIKLETEHNQFHHAS